MAEVNIASILQGIPLAALAIDANQRVSVMNAEAVSLLGRGCWIGTILQCCDSPLCSKL